MTKAQGSFLCGCALMTTLNTMHVTGWVSLLLTAVWAVSMLFGYGKMEKAAE